MRGSFFINSGKENLVRGKSVLLVDDVITTGATINECSKILKRAGCKEVHVFTLARTMN